MKTLKTKMSTVVLTLLRSNRVTQRFLTQEAMAKMFGKTASSYTKLELGHTKLDMTTLFRMACVLNTSTSGLVAKAERICAELSAKGWLIISDCSDESDDLLRIHRAGEVLPFSTKDTGLGKAGQQD